MENAGKLKLLRVGYSLRAPEMLFRKIDDVEIKAQIEKLRSGLVKTVTSSPLPVTGNQEQETGNRKPEIQYDDFSKLELRVGTILSAEKVAKADKLLKLEVNLGFEKRTIVSGIALHSSSTGVINWKTSCDSSQSCTGKLKGIESNGMILSKKMKMANYI